MTDDFIVSYIRLKSKRSYLISQIACTTSHATAWNISYMSHMFASAKTVCNRITCILHSAIHTSPIPNNIPPSHIPHPASKPMKIPHTCIHHMNMYQPPPEPSNQKLPSIPFTPPLLPVVQSAVRTRKWDWETRAADHHLSGQCRRGKHWHPPFTSRHYSTRVG